MSRARVRRTDPDTSHQAAARLGDLGESQRAVLVVLRVLGRPVLDEEMIREYNRRRKSLMLPEQSESGLRTRRAELVDAGKVLPHEKTKMSTGGTGWTWYAAPREES